MHSENTPPEKVQQEIAALEASTAPEPTLPPLAAQADDLNILKKTVEDAAGAAAALWFSYIFVLFYIAIAAGGVTHVDLLLERPVKLPFLNVELPLTAFFFLAPIIFVIVHVYVLTHFVLLGRKAKRFHEELLSQIPSRDPEDQCAAKKRDKLRGQLPSNVFVQFLAGPRDVRDSAFGVLLRAIAYVTLVFGPLALLLLLQIQFLPYHNKFITWIMRITLSVDLGLIWWLWRDIISGRGEYERWFQWTKLGMPLLFSLSSLSLIVFSFFVATSPDENSLIGPKFFSPDWFWTFGPSILSKEDHDKQLNLREALFEGPVDEVTRKPKSLLSNRLVLTGFNLLSELKIEDNNKIYGKKHTFVFRGRNFQKAIFDLSELPNVDLTGANLQEASLNNSNLKSASLYTANLQGASLNKADLQDARIVSAKLQHASLYDAHLQGASLNNSNLESASLYTANLQGSSLQSTNLQGASLNNSNLQDASLNDAYLKGASLNRANLRGARLRSAHLQGATLYYANLQGASLYQANLQGASLQSANLQGASLQSAKLQGATLVSANLQGASLQSANLQGASLQSASLQGVSLGDSNLQGADLSFALLHATDFSGARTWRTFLPEKGTILLGSDLKWRPDIEDDVKHKPWTNVNYDQLRYYISTRLADSELREVTLSRINILNCARDDLTPCVDDLEKAVKPQKMSNFEMLAIDTQKYRKSLAEVLNQLVCKDSEENIYVLRGVLSNYVAVHANKFLFKTIQNVNICPVATKLTDTDKKNLNLAEAKATAQNKSILTNDTKKLQEKAQAHHQK